MYLPSLKLLGQSVLELSVAQGEVDWHDLWPWPTDLNINRGHLLIQDHLPTKFEASGANGSWVISCTRLRDTDIQTDRPTYRQTDMCKAICPSFFKGGHKYELNGKCYKNVLNLISGANPTMTGWDGHIWMGDKTNLQVWVVFNSAQNLPSCSCVKISTSPLCWRRNFLRYWTKIPFSEFSYAYIPSLLQMWTTWCWYLI